MSTTSRCFTLPDTHLAALQIEATHNGMSLDVALAQAIHVYRRN